MEDLLARFFAGEATRAEQEEVKKWRNASEENAREYQAFQEAWLISELRPDDQSAEAMLEYIFSNEKTPQVVPLWRQRTFQIAASLILVVAAVFAVVRFTSADLPLGVLVAEVSTFKLPDGSTVTLQRGSQLDMMHFDTARIVKLSGKGYFEVKPNAKKPFHVLTTQGHVTVLGTSFMVMSMPGQPATQVIVTSGVVSLEQRPEVFGANVMRLQLTAGETGELVEGRRGIRKQKNKDDNFLAWKTRELTFRRTSMKEVADLLYDTYGVTLSFENAALANCRLTARFEQKTPEEIMPIIAETFGITYVQQGDVYALSGDGCSR